MTFDGIALLATVALISVGFLAYSLWEWKIADRRRREDRLTFRNLMKAVGR